MNRFIDELKLKSKRSYLVWMLIILMAFVLGLNLSNNRAPDSGATSQKAENNVSSHWTCSMHPQIQQPDPGDCPICGMDLIPVSSGSSEENPRAVKISASAQKLANIAVATVERKFVEKVIQLTGKVIVDETRLSYITARVPGRIDRLFVNYTGISVKRGDHLVELYSPELLTTQRELIETVRQLEAVNATSNLNLININKTQLQAVRERLKLWGITDAQISALEKSKTASERLTLYSPVSGVVIRQDALEGAYVNTGTRIFTIANLEKVWILLDAYESDLAWLHYGQKVTFTTEAYAGERFSGRVSFIDPVLDSKTRTVKVRVNMDNAAGKLKPQMFVRATVRARLAGEGKLIDESLSGKWISPMHPEIIKDKPGSCDVCGMPLVRAEELGFMPVGSISQAVPLVIPVSAPLITGKRAVVYVAVPGQTGIFEGRDIELGARAGDYYLVKSGLKAGEKVVVKGNFKIDSAIQIKAGKSMMNPDGAVLSVDQKQGIKKDTAVRTASELSEEIERFSDIPQKFLNQLDVVYDAYFKIQYNLSHDEFDPVKPNALKMKQALVKTDMKLLDGPAHDFWIKSLEKLKKSLTAMEVAKNMDGARGEFEHLSIQIILMAKAYGSDQANLLIYNCPMAFDFKGADWLQNKKGTENPYFGSQMFKCGSEVADLKSIDEAKSHEGHHHD